jgi:N-acetylglutamate synthase-like GNAT family acetyltransferase
MRQDPDDVEATQAVHLRPASAVDWDDVTALLRAASLPLDGVSEQFPASYFVAISGQQMVGTAGLERHGEHGLLRSLAVATGWQRRGVGGALVRQVQGAAAALGLTPIYLLTTTATTFFPRHGFVSIARAEVPAMVRAAPEFASICPGSATCFCWIKPDGTSDPAGESLPLHRAVKR